MGTSNYLCDGQVGNSKLCLSREFAQKNHEQSSSIQHQRNCPMSYAPPVLWRRCAMASHPMAHQWWIEHLLLSPDRKQWPYIPATEQKAWQIRDELAEGLLKASKMWAGISQLNTIDPLYSFQITRHGRNCWAVRFWSHNFRTSPNQLINENIVQQSYILRHVLVWR